MKFGVIVALLLSWSVLAQEFPDRRFPVTLSVEGRHVLTTIGLTLPFKSFFVPASAMASMNLTGHERAFIRFLDAVRTNNVVVVREMLHQPPAISTTDNELRSVTVAPETPEQFLKLFRAAFNEFEDLLIVAEIPKDDGSLFLWQGMTAKGPLLRGFIVLDIEGAQKVTPVTMTRPADVFIVNTLGQLKLNQLAAISRDEVPQSIDEKLYSFALDSKGARLEFKGDVINTSVHDPNTEQGTPVAALQESAASLQAGERLRFLSFFTKRSSEKLEQWFSTMTPDAFDAYVRDQALPRFVKFVLDGGNVSVVFWTRSSTSDWPADSLNYNYLVTEGENLRIANIFFQGFFDDVLATSDPLRQMIRSAHMPDSESQIISD